MDTTYLKTKARECKSLADITLNREVRDALDKLATEFDEQAALLAKYQTHSGKSERDSS